MALNAEIEKFIENYTPYSVDSVVKKLQWLRDHALDNWIACRSGGKIKDEQHVMNVFERAANELVRHQNMIIATKDGKFTGQMVLRFEGTDYGATEEK